MIDVPQALLESAEVMHPSKCFEDAADAQVRPPSDITLLAEQRIHDVHCSVLHLEGKTAGCCAGCIDLRRSLRTVVARDEARAMPANCVPILVSGETVLLPPNVASPFTPNSQLTQVCCV